MNAIMARNKVHIQKGSHTPRVVERARPKFQRARSIYFLSPNCQHFVLRTRVSNERLSAQLFTSNRLQVNHNGMHRDPNSLMLSHSHSRVCSKRRPHVCVHVGYAQGGAYDVECLSFQFICMQGEGTLVCCSLQCVGFSHNSTPSSSLSFMQVKCHNGCDLCHSQ